MLTDFNDLQAAAGPAAVAEAIKQARRPRKQNETTAGELFDSSGGRVIQHQPAMALIYKVEDQRWCGLA